MGYRVYFDFDDTNGWQLADLMLDGLSRTQSAYNDELFPNVNRATITIADDETLRNLILTNNEVNHKQTKVKIEKTSNGTDWTNYFVGYVRDTVNLTTSANRVNDIKIEIVDFSFFLKKKIDTTSVIIGKKICDPADPGNSILHLVFAAAGLSADDIADDIITISTIIPYFVLEGDKSYWDCLSTLLNNNCYVFYVDSDGAFNIYDLTPADITTVKAFDNTNLLNAIKLEKQNLKYDGAKVIWYGQKTETDVIIFSDTTGGDDNNKCNIAVDDEHYYPEVSGESDWYAEYQLDGKELLCALNADLDTTYDSGITIVAESYDNKKAKISFYNDSGSTKNITKFDIVGDAVYKGEKTITSVVNDPASNNLSKIEAQYILTKEQAQKYATMYARYYRYSNIAYTIESDTVYEPNDIVTLTENEIGLNASQTCRIVSVKEVIVCPINGAEIINRIYTLQGISAYTALDAVHEVLDNNPPPPIVTPSDVKLLAETKIIEGFEGSNGTLIPSVPIISVCQPVGIRSILLIWDKQLNLTNPSHYEIQVSDDGITWYSLKFDGTDWKDVEGADTDKYTEMLVHAGIPNAGTTEAPTGKTLYYQVRRVTKAALASDWSDPASTTTNTVQAGDLAADSVYANNIIASEVTALLIKTDELYVGYKSSTGGTINDPHKGDKVLYISGVTITYYEYVNGDWSNFDTIILGNEIGGLFNSRIGCTGLYHPNDPPTSVEYLQNLNFRVFNFNNNYLDQDGNAMSAANSAFSSAIKKFGSHSLYGTASTTAATSALGNYFTDSFTPGQPQAFACYYYPDNALANDRDIMYYNAYSFANTYLKFRVDSDGHVVFIWRKGTADTEHTLLSTSTVTVGAHNYIGFNLDTTANTIDIILNNEITSISLGVASWEGTGSYFNVNFYYYYKTGPYYAYFDELLLYRNNTYAPELLAQHYNHNTAWVTNGIQKSDSVWSADSNNNGRCVATQQITAKNGIKSDSGYLNASNEYNYAFQYIVNPATGWFASKTSGWTSDSFSGGLLVNFSSVVTSGTKAILVNVYSNKDVYWRKNGDTNISNTPAATLEIAHICGGVGPTGQAIIYLSTDYKAQFAVHDGTGAYLYVSAPIAELR